jgi:hypothetical protein
MDLCAGGLIYDLNPCEQLAEKIHKGPDQSSQNRHARRPAEYDQPD